MRANGRLLRYAAVALAVIVAVVHLLHPDFGIWALMVYVSIPAFPDPRPPAFVLSAVAILLSIALVADGALSPRAASLGGIALMIVYIVGYFGWHMFGHGAWWPWGSGLGGHSHTFLEILLGDGHLRDDPIALGSKLAELALLVVLALIYADESG
ncbi:MAG: hypothetical protein QXG03_04800 [Halalkalicoccus sp.]